ncbi:MAG: RNA 2'-phosphotransferase [Desulfobacterales bacterium]
MNRKRVLTRLSKLIATALRHDAYAHGLVPDADGFVTIKALLQALNDIEGWRRLRKSDLEEVVASLPEPGIEIDGTRIRATGVCVLPSPDPGGTLPKLLYVGIRRRAHAAVLQNGLRIPASDPRLVLADDPDAADRMGRRKDNDPVLVTVNVRQALAAGAVISEIGGGLFKVEGNGIPASVISLPPLPKERPQAEAPPTRVKPPPSPQPAGSFILDPNRWAEPGQPKSRTSGKRKDPDWKRERKRSKRR